MSKRLHICFALIASALSTTVCAAERTLVFSGYVDGVNENLGDRVRVGDLASVSLTYDWDGSSYVDNDDYRYYNSALKSGFVSIGSYRIDMLDGYGASVYTQDSQPGEGPDRFITSFSDIPARALNGYGVWGMFVAFDDGSGTAFASQGLPSSPSDLKGFNRAGLAIDYGPNGRYRIGAVLPNFSFVNAGVPEVTTWALMLLGFGMTGSAVRSGRQRHKLQSV